MSSGDVLSSEFEESVLNCLGERFQHGLIKVVRMETKGEKVEPKVLALSKYRGFILSFKSPTKLEHEFHYLEIHHMESLKPLQLKIHVSVKKDSLPKTVYNLSTDSAEEVDAIIEFIALEVKKCFPNSFSSDNIIPRITRKPESRQISLNMKLEESFPDPGPCGGFTQMYACMCSLHQEPYMPEVAWDVDTIYLSQDSKDLCLNDFDHLSNRDLVPIIAALIHNNWFTKLSFRNASKLSVDATREINKVLQKSSCIEQLILDNVGLKWSFTQDMCTATMANPNTALCHITLSNNPLEDRGIRYLSSLLTRLPSGLVELNLSRTGLTADGTLHLGKALTQNNFMATSLVKLDVSGNTFKDGDISSLTGFLAQPNSLTHLNLADTECALDNVFVALFRGCSSSLSHLNLAGNTFTYRKGKDVPIQVSFKQFFSTCTSLKYLNLSRNKLPSEVVKEVLNGIASNNNLQDVELDLSSNELKTEGGHVVAGSIGHIHNIATLNLSDNDFNMELARLVDWIGQNKTLQSLDISKNMSNLKYKQLLKVLETIVQLIQNEELSLHTLSLADNKMKFETIQIINALGSNTTLTSVDISGNGMGDIGARMLAKALQLNTKLRTVKLDCNGITDVGFTDLANALEKNYTLKYMPTPVNDVSSSMKSHPEKTSASLQKIQNFLQRNHSEHKFHDDQAFRLQQGFLYTTSHQMVDKLMVQLQDCIKGLIDCTDDDVQATINKAQVTMLDADNSKLLLAALHQVALNAESNDLKEKLNDIADQLKDIVEAQLQNSATGMLDTATKQCSSVMQECSTVREGLDNMCQEQTKLPARFLEDVVEQVGAAISNRVGEAHLAMASHISDTIIDELMEQLSDSYQKLCEQLTDFRIRKGSILPNGTELGVNSKEEDEDKKNQNGEMDNDEEAKSPDGAALSPSRLASVRLYQRREMGRSDSVRFKDSEAGQQKKIGRVRPRSIIMKDFELTLVEVDADSGDKLENDVADGTVSSKPPISPAPTKSPTAKPSKTSAKQAALDTKELDQLTTTTQTLTDVRKNRVRPPRQRPSRPANVAQKTTPVAESDPVATGAVDAGISDFFSAGLTDLAPATSESHTANSVQNLNSASPDLKSKKTKTRLFQKKSRDEEKPKKEEPTKGKKFGGFKGIFKKKHSLPSTEEPVLDQPVKQETRHSSLSHGFKSPEQISVTTEVKKKAPPEEPMPKIVEKKPLQLPSVHRSVKATASVPKEPEPTPKQHLSPEPKEKEDKKVPESSAEVNEDAGSQEDNSEPTEVEEPKEEPKGDTPHQEEKKEPEAKEGAAKEEAEEAPKEKTEEVPKETEAKDVEEDAKKEEEKKEEPKKPVPEARKPGLAGAQMIGGASMFQEMKLRREKKAADRASREILESQAPKVEENQVKETSDDPAPAASPTEKKPVPGIKLSLPKLPTPGPTSPESGVKSPKSPPQVLPTKPVVSTRVKSPVESSRKSPLEKAPSNQPPPETIEPKSPQQASKQNDHSEESDKPKPEKEKPIIRPRPLSGKMDVAPPHKSPTPPTTPETSTKANFSLSPSDALKRNSLDAKTKEEEHPVISEKKSNGIEIPKPSPRPGSLADDKPQDLSAGKPNESSVSPKPKPRPAKRPISIGKKPEVPEARKPITPAVNVIPSQSKPEDKHPLPETVQQKTRSLIKEPVKLPPTIASKPRSRSLDPTTTSKIDPKPLQPKDTKDDALLEVPSSQDRKRDSVLSRSSDEGTMEDVDQITAI